MRIAICYSGEARDVHKTFQNHQDFLFQHHDVDIYIHTWTPTTIPVHEGRPGFLEPITTVDDYRTVFNPVRMQVDDPVYATDSPQSAQIRRASMFKSMQRSVQLVRSDVSYQYIVRMRTDIALMSPVKFELLQPGVIYIPTFINMQTGCIHPNHDAWCTDVMMIGDPDIMRRLITITNRGDIETNPLPPETYMVDFMRTSDIPWSSIDTRVYLSRITTVVPTLRSYVPRV